jgi:hypothetical protein
LKPRFLLLAVLAIPTATALALSSCNQVVEPISGLTARRGDTCVRLCREDYKSDVAECDRALRLAIRACRQLPQSQREACYAQATADFTVCTDEAEQQQAECLSGCHNQGGGSTN